MIASFHLHTKIGKILLVYSTVEIDTFGSQDKETSFWIVKVRSPDEDVATLFGIPTTATELVNRESTNINLRFIIEL